MLSELGKKTKITLVCSVVVCAIASVALYLSQDSWFRNGLEKLPDRPCDGAVRGATVKEILPATREVKDRYRYLPTDRNFAAFCSVRTSEGSVLSSHADIRDGNIEGMREWLESQGEYDGKVVALGNEVEAQTGPTSAAVYLPCTPDQPGSDAVHSYILSVETRILGDSRAEGDDLRRSLLEISVQSAEHARSLVQCREPLPGLEVGTSTLQ